MEDKRNLHLKVQELIDCYATSDPLKSMSELSSDEDKNEAALKWVALSALHGINNGAEKIKLIKKGDGKVTVTASYRKAELPSPGLEVANNIIESVRSITHLEKAKGKERLALGIRNDSIEINVKVKRDGDDEVIELKFPD